MFAEQTAFESEAKGVHSALVMIHLFDQGQLE
jgi:hypothetical protein